MKHIADGKSNILVFNTSLPFVARSPKIPLLTGVWYSGRTFVVDAANLSSPQALDGNALARESDRFSPLLARASSLAPRLYFLLPTGELYELDAADGGTAPSARRLGWINREALSARVGARVRDIRFHEVAAADDETFTVLVELAPESGGATLRIVQVPRKSLAINEPETRAGEYAPSLVPLGWFGEGAAMRIAAFAPERNRLILFSARGDVQREHALLSQAQAKFNADLVKFEQLGVAARSLDLDDPPDKIPEATIEVYPFGEVSGAELFNLQQASLCRCAAADDVRWILYLGLEDGKVYLRRLSERDLAPAATLPAEGRVVQFDPFVVGGELVVLTVEVSQDKRRLSFRSYRKRGEEWETMREWSPPCAIGKLLGIRDRLRSCTAVSEKGGIVVYSAASIQLEMPALSGSSAVRHAAPPVLRRKVSR